MCKSSAKQISVPFRASAQQLHIVAKCLEFVDHMRRMADRIGSRVIVSSAPPPNSSYVTAPPGAYITYDEKTQLVTVYFKDPECLI